MAIIGYIPPAAEPIPAVNAQPVPDNAPPAEAAVELPFPELTDTAAEEKPAKRTKRRRPRSKPMTSYEFTSANMAASCPAGRVADRLC